MNDCAELPSYFQTGNVTEKSSEQDSKEEDGRATYPSTLSVDCTEWVSESSGVQFMCWDICCRPNFLPVMPLFLTKGSVYVLVVCMSDSDMVSTCRHWLQRLHIIHGRPLPSVLLVGHRADMQSSYLKENLEKWETIEQTLSSEFPCIRGRVLCSSYTGEGIQLVRSAIVKLGDTRVSMLPVWEARDSAIATTFLVTQFSNNYPSF